MGPLSASQPVCPSSLYLPARRSETSIVDATPGTTADTKVQLMELHDVGPAKLFDTGGWVGRRVVVGGSRRGKQERRRQRGQRICWPAGFHTAAAHAPTAPCPQPTHFHLLQRVWTRRGS